MRSLIVPLITLSLTTVFAGDGETPSADPESEFFKAGKKVYNTVCFACHQMDGKGLPGAFPTLHESPWVGGRPERLLSIVLDGLTGPMEIGGQAFNSEMPPQGPLLSDLQLAQVVTYVRNVWGNESPPVTPAFVAKVRRSSKPRNHYWSTEELLKKFPFEDGSSYALTGARYALYHGEWTELPDFEKLTPVLEKDVKEGTPLPSKHVGRKRSEDFGVVYTGTFRVPKKQTYTFSLTSHERPRLLIGGKTIIGNTGVHTKKTSEQKIELDAGEHSFRMEWFQGKKHKYSGFYLGYIRPGAKEVRLADGKRPGGPLRSDDPIGFPLVSEGGRAKIYRNFIVGAGPRAIGVGYPGKLNLAWDAANMRPALLWHGRFIDAARHWKGRGQGFQHPLEKKVTSLAPGVPFAFPGGPAAPWDTSQERPSEKLRESAYVFDGYTLGKDGFPTFRYRFHDVEVADYYCPAGEKTLERTVSFTGLKKVLHHRVATGKGTIKAVRPGVFILDDTLEINLPPESEPALSETGAGQELRALITPVNGGATLKTRFTFLH